MISDADIARPLAVVGDSFVTHESGTHVAAFLTEAATCQGLGPGLCGRQHRMAIGRHPGSGAITHVLSEDGIALDTGLGPVLTDVMRTEAISCKRSSLARELADIGQRRQAIRAGTHGASPEAGAFTQKELTHELPSRRQAARRHQYRRPAERPVSD